MSKEFTKLQAMLDWLVGGGGQVHQHTVLRNDVTMGPSLFASSIIPANQPLIACPVDLVITPETATLAICEILNIHKDDLVWPVGSSSSGKSWNERMRICVYLCLHWIYTQDRHISENEFPSVLRHGAYIASLPAFETLLTPLWMTEDEKALLDGTNLSGAVSDREKEWMEEIQAVKSIKGLEGVTWKRYLAAATFLSSRAFPSSLLQLGSSDDPLDPKHGKQLVKEEEESHPVLIPGLDLLNHNAEAPVLWRRSSTSSVSSMSPSGLISIESAGSISANSQIWNNYGPRSNEELLLGYGFVIPDNPHDTVILKLGSSTVPEAKLHELQLAKLDANKRYYLRRNGVIDQDLLRVLRILLSDEQFTGHDHHGHAVHQADVEEDEVDEHAQMEKEQREIELELDVLGMLGGMLDDKLAKLDEEPSVPNARPVVREMCQVYRKGQKDIITTAMDKISERIDKLETMLDSGMTCSCCM